MQEQEHKSHMLIAQSIVRGNMIIPGKYDLAAQITSALDYIRLEERTFWLQALKGAAELCEQRGQHEGAAVIRALLESAKQV